jgi:hypothetical protein
LHRKNAQGDWEVFEFGPGAELTLQSIPGSAMKLSIVEIYEDVDWEQDSGLSVREESEDEWTEEDDESDEEEDDLDW